MLLECIRCTTADVVKATVHVADLNDFDRLNSAYDRAVPSPRLARTTDQSGLGHEIGDEIDVIAIRGFGAVATRGAPTGNLGITAEYVA